MNKIELKHVAGYLPYGLKMISQNDFVAPLIRELRVDGFQFMIDTRKPILRPLSDLTKEIEVNGEKIVPVLIIAKMFGFGDLEKFELDDDVVAYGWVERYMDDSQPYSFGYFQNGEFGTWYDDIDDSHPIQTHCKMEVIEWLYEHHFDIHDLIGKEIAIDINTLEK